MWSFSSDERSPQGIIAEMDLFVKHHNPLLFKHPCPSGTLRHKVLKVMFSLPEPLKFGMCCRPAQEGDVPALVFSAEGEGPAQPLSPGWDGEQPVLPGVELVPCPVEPSLSHGQQPLGCGSCSSASPPEAPAGTAQRDRSLWHCQHKRFTKAVSAFYFSSVLK